MARYSGSVLGLAEQGYGVFSGFFIIGGRT